MKKIIFLILALPFLVQAAPANSSDFYILKGQMINIEDGAYVEGSVGHGGLQPDYKIDFNDPGLKEVLALAAEIGRQPLDFWVKVADLRDLISQRVLIRGGYKDPGYLKLLETYRNQNKDVPLAAYITCEAGVCRENGMLLHLALKAAGIDNNYVYAVVTQEYQGVLHSEGHGFTVVLHEGTNWVVDSYNDNFNGLILEDLLKPQGADANSPRAPFSKVIDQVRVTIKKISNFPLVWNPKQRLEAAVGSPFINESNYQRPPVNAGEFIEPNELHPEVAAGLYRSGGDGVHISVGSERGFIGFAMNKNATHLLLADVDHAIVFYNQINIALLQLSEGFEDYKALRGATSHSDWLGRLPKDLQIKKGILIALKSPDVFKWWQGRVSNNPSFAEKNRILGLNSYLNDPVKFHRIYKAAKEGRIQASRLNLTSPSQLVSLSTEMQRKNLKISLLDFSSAWMPRYISNTGVPDMLEKLQGVFNKESVLLLTKGTNEYGYWKYIAFKEQYLKGANPDALNGNEIQKIFDSYKGSMLYEDTPTNFIRTKVLNWFGKKIRAFESPQCSRVFSIED